MAILVIAGSATSCSDEENNSSYENLLWVNGQEKVLIAECGLKSTTPRSLDVAFTSPDKWQISAIDLETDKPADWVAFQSNSGESGLNSVGIIPAANPTGKERAATITVSDNINLISLTLIQQAETAIPNPNEASISPNKTVEKIEYYETSSSVGESGSETLKFSWAFTYDNQGNLNSIVKKEIRWDNSVADSEIFIKREGDLNKVTFDYKAADYEDKTVFGIVNGKAIIGYYFPESNLSQTTGRIIDFGYNPYSIGTLSWDNGETTVKHSFRWEDGNLISAECFSPYYLKSGNLTYSNYPNDCNIDLNYFLLYQFMNSDLGAPSGFSALGAMNLFGIRSARIASDYGEDFIHYAISSGVTDENGQSRDGLTLTGSSTSYKIFFK